MMHYKKGKVSQLPNIGYKARNTVFWMQQPSAAAAAAVVEGVSPGLEYLLDLDRLIVQQQIDSIDTITGWKESTNYLIKTSSGQNVYFAAEETDHVMRQCCSEYRGFTIHIVDHSNQECLRIKREFKCCAGCCWCAGCCDSCGFEVKVETPAGQVMGYVRQKGSFWKAQYDILDANHEPVMKIHGPWFTCKDPCCSCDNNFELTSLNGIVCGKIAKQYTEIAIELFTSAENFMIEFPQDLAVSVKATLLGALFLIVSLHCAVSFFTNKKMQ